MSAGPTVMRSADRPSRRGAHPPRADSTNARNRNATRAHRRRDRDGVAERHEHKVRGRPKRVDAPARSSREIGRGSRRLAPARWRTHSSRSRSSAARRARRPRSPCTARALSRARRRLPVPRAHSRRAAQRVRTPSRTSARPRDVATCRAGRRRSFRRTRRTPRRRPRIPAHAIRSPRSRRATASRRRIVRRAEIDDPRLRREQRVDVRVVLIGERNGDGLRPFVRANAGTITNVGAMYATRAPGSASERNAQSRMSSEPAPVTTCCGRTPA